MNPENPHPGESAPQAADAIWVNILAGVPDPKYHFKTKAEADEFNKSAGTKAIYPIPYVPAAPQAAARGPLRSHPIIQLLRNSVRSQNPLRDDTWRALGLDVLALLESTPPASPQAPRDYTKILDMVLCSFPGKMSKKLRHAIVDKFAARAACPGEAAPQPAQDPDLGNIGPGHVCKHGIRYPHECRPCADAAWEHHQQGQQKGDAA